MIRDYYAVLDLEINADYALIKQRYRQLVRENHPDIAADKDAAHAKMQLILEAWKVLSDPSRRARYDNELAAYRGESKKDMAPSGTYSSHAPANVQPWESRPAPSNEQRDRFRPSGQSRAPSYGSPRPSQNPRTKLLTMVFEAAQLYHKEGRVAEAITVCNRVMKADPTNVDAVALLGDIYASQNRKDIALAMFERAMRLQPNNALYRQKWNQLRHGNNPNSNVDMNRGPEPEAAPKAAANSQTVHSVLFNSGPKRRGLSERLGDAEVTPPPLRRNASGSSGSESGTPDSGEVGRPEPEAVTIQTPVDDSPSGIPEVQPTLADEEGSDSIAAASADASVEEPISATSEEPVMAAAEAAEEETANAAGSFMDRFKARLKR